MITGDLRDEEWREYEMPDGNGGTFVYRIANPVTLFLREGGSTHRVLDAQGIVHLLPGPGYRGTAIRWKPRNPEAPVAF